MTSAELFPILEGLGFDVNTGIELCGGDDAFYCDLIEELYRDVLVRRNEALRQGGQDARREYAHLLKGTLQVLGEGVASGKARELEQAIREGAPHEELNRQLAEALDRIHAALEAQFGPRGSP